jgi:hypothetical protein
MNHILKRQGKTLTARRNNPDYSQVTGLIPKELAHRFRVYCVENEILLTEALEIAIQEFLDKRQNENSLPEAKKGFHVNNLFHEADASTAN